MQNIPKKGKRRERKREREREKNARSIGEIMIQNTRNKLAWYRSFFSSKLLQQHVVIVVHITKYRQASEKRAIFKVFYQKNKTTYFCCVPHLVRKWNCLLFIAFLICFDFVIGEFARNAVKWTIKTHEVNKTLDWFHANELFFDS